MRGIVDILRSAKISIRLIDDSVTEDTLKLFVFAGTDVPVKIYMKDKLAYEIKRNMKRRKTFSKGLDLIVTNYFSSNRYLIIDDKFMYIISRPLRQFSSRGFCFIRIFDFDETRMMIFRTKLAENYAKKRVYAGSQSRIMC